MKIPTAEEIERAVYRLRLEAEPNLELLRAAIISSTLREMIGIVLIDYDARGAEIVAPKEKLEAVSGGV